jgi:hypothetical protein
LIHRRWHPSVFTCNVWSFRATDCDTDHYPMHLLVLEHFGYENYQTNLYLYGLYCTFPLNIFQWELKTGDYEECHLLRCDTMQLL